VTQYQFGPFLKISRHLLAKWARTTLTGLEVHYVQYDFFFSVAAWF
jgi:hypothetical protein